jgi:hypothetical protein
MGEVAALQGDRYLVRSDEGEFWSERATSCMLLPVVGDRVLLCAQLPDEVYVLAVLARPPNCIQRTTLGEGVTLDVTQPGHLEICAQSAVRVQTAEVGVVARSANVMVSQLSSVVRDAFFGFTTARWVGDVFEASVGRMAQWMGSSQRTVKGLDHVRAGSSEVFVDQIMSLNGKQVLITAEKLARIDGDQVHIG